MAAPLLLCIIAGLLFILHKMLNAKLNYWKERGIPHITPKPYVGNMLSTVLKRKTFAEVLRDVGVTFKNEPVVGFYNFTKPTLIINSPEYAELVLVKEFSTFMNRGEDLKIDERRPLDKHLFFLTGSSWKGVRSKMTPVFTMVKLKGMLPEIERLFDKTFQNVNDKSETIDFYDIVEKFTIWVRGSCVFGIDLTKSNSAEEEFFKTVKNISKHSIVTLAQNVSAMFFPKLAKLLNLSFFGSENDNYFVKVLSKAFKERSETKNVKQDFIQTLIELKNKGKVDVQYWSKEDDILKTEDKNLITETVEIDDDILFSQLLIFLVAGLEPELSTLSMLMVELIQNPSVLEKLTQEIDSVIDQYKEFSYEALKEMKYLELCLQETLRMYTPAEILVRNSIKTFTFPNGVTIDKGTYIVVPLLKYHSDPDIHADPSAFKPERFIDNSYPPGGYIPFGLGPRICIATRFAMLEMKLFAAKLLYNYSITLDPKTELPVQIDKWCFLRKIMTPIYIKFSSRTH